MKLKVQTITGVTHEIQVEERWTIKEVKKEIYKSKKITGAVRILKKQEILPDDSTLVQHNISDGDTVSIVIEPEKQIVVAVTCNLGTFKHEISNSLLVRDLKQKLIDSEQVASLPGEFDFEIKVPDTAVLILEDDSLPLHEYGIRNDCKLVVVRPFLFLTLMSQNHSEKVFTKVATKTSVKELEETVLQLFSDKKGSGFSIFGATHDQIEYAKGGPHEVAGISLFVTNDQTEYVKVGQNKDLSVGEILSDGQTICYLENKSDYSTCFPVKLGDVEMANAYGDENDVVKIIKLRVQNQLSIPANRVNVTTVSGNTLLGDNVKIINTQIIVHVDDSIAQHEYGIQDNCKLLLDRPYVFLTMINQMYQQPQQHHSYQPRKVYKKVPKKTTVRELKKMIVQLFCKSVTGDICLFKTKDETKYVKVGPNLDVSVGEILSDGQTVCYIEDKRNYNTCWPVKLGKTEIGNVYGELKDTVRTIKLRVQDQLSIPVSCVLVSRKQRDYCDAEPVKDDIMIADSDHIIVHRKY